MNTAQLKTELTTDPNGLGYAGKADAQLAALLNSFTGPGAAVVAIASMARSDFLLGIAPATFVLPSLSAALQSKWDRILSLARSADQINVASATVQALLATAVSDGVLTQAQSDAISKRTGSRAEVLFGAGTSVSELDIARAMGRTA